MRDRWMDGARYRFRQGAAALSAGRDEPVDDICTRWLSDGELELFRRMSAHDRAHALRVAGLLLAAGHRDVDLIAGALLHDAAKSGTPGCPGRVRLPDRVLRVLLARVAPSVLVWLTTDPDRPGCRGLYLAVHHARLGAVAAGAAGSTARTRWLIANHDGSRGIDAHLDALIAADDGAH